MVTLAFVSFDKPRQPQSASVRGLLDKAPRRYSRLMSAICLDYSRFPEKYARRLRFVPKALVLENWTDLKYEREWHLIKSLIIFQLSLVTFAAAFSLPDCAILKIWPTFEKHIRWPCLACRTAGEFATVMKTFHGARKLKITVKSGNLTHNCDEQTIKIKFISSYFRDSCNIK